MQKWLALAGLTSLMSPLNAHAATVYTSESSYLSALSGVGVSTQTLLSFDELSANTVLDDDYAGLGVRFSSNYGITLQTTVYGSAARGSLAAVPATGTNPSSYTLSFDVGQRAVGFYTFDQTYPITVQAYSSSTLVDTVTIDAAAEDLAGGLFRGITFGSAITRLVVTAQQTDGIGFDDLRFVSTDADGDGYGPGSGSRGGDCNDANAAIYPGATEVVDGKDQDCDGVIDNQYLVYTDELAYSDDVSLDGFSPQTVVDFEDLTTNALVADAYLGLGLAISSASDITAQTDVHGSAPHGKYGAKVAGTNLASYTYVFDLPQSYMACRFLDVGTPITITAYDDGGMVNKFSISPLAEDLAGGLFRGFYFNLPFTRLTITSSSASDGIGFDDITFVSLDEDGDGYGPGTGRRGGDCNDADPNTYPGAPELPADGIDQDCDGLVDNAVTIYTNPTQFQTDGINKGVPAFTKIDFEGLAETAAIGTQYTNLGIVFGPTPGLTAEANVYGTKPRNTRGAKVTSTAPATTTWTFTESQKFVSAYWLDLSGAVTVKAYSKNKLINTFTFTGAGEDTAGGIFRGFSFSQAVDAITFVGSSGDGIGFDDVQFDAVDDDKDGYTIAQGDCNDLSASVNPAATESCNGVDDDCDSSVDEGFDKDSDGVTTCQGDCNDNNDQVKPGREEVCDRLDNDCDNSIDEGFDQDGDGFSTCASPVADCNDKNAAIYPGATETCNGADDDCDSAKDEGFDKDNDGFYVCVQEGKPSDCNDNASGVNPEATEVPYDGVDQDCSGADLTDVDGDGFAGGKPGSGAPDCNDTDVTINPNSLEVPYNGVDEDCSGSDLSDVDGDGFNGPSGIGSDCDDAVSYTYPGAPEIDDNEDNDCDGQVDENLDTTDDDKDGYSEATGDCNDTRKDVHPGAIEIPYNGIDEDCSGADETDVDGDSYPGGGGSDCNDEVSSINPGAAEVPYNGIDEDCSGSDLVDQDKDGVSGGSNGGDCDDLDPTRFPGATETPYDGIDQDCSGADLTDVDADGVKAVQAGGSDCDDSNANISPNAPEVEDGIDNDCDGVVDEGSGSFDDDSDGFSEAGGDCNDADASIHPGAEDVAYNGIDEDCQDGDLTDVDADGFDGGDGGEDCEDDDASIHPGVEDICGNGVDEDCDLSDAECTPTPTPDVEPPTATPDVTPTITPSGESPTPSATPGETTPPESPSPHGTGTPTVDSPTPVEPTATPDNGGTNSPTPTPDTGGSGCSCNTESNAPVSAGALGLWLVGCLALYRRRRTG